MKTIRHLLALAAFVAAFHPLHAEPPFSVEALAEAFGAIQALPDSEVDHYRQRAAQSCRARFAPEVISRRLQTLLAPGS